MAGATQWQWSRWWGGGRFAHVWHEVDVLERIMRRDVGNSIGIRMNQLQQSTPLFSAASCAANAEGVVVPSDCR